MLREGEIEGKGVGHAEVTGGEAAKGAALTPTKGAASRPICKDCADYYKRENIQPMSPLKQYKE